MQIYTGGEAVAQPFPGLEIVTLEPGLTPSDIREFAGKLAIPEQVNMQGAPVPQRPAQLMGEVADTRRTPNNPRDAWAPDHLWHFDWGHPDTDPQATVLYARTVKGDVAGTEFIDTSMLLAAIERDNSGISDELAASRTVFSTARYYTEVLPVLGTPAAVRQTLERWGAASLEEIAQTEAEKYPAKSYPTIAQHPFRGEREPCVMIDAARVVEIAGVPPERGRALAQRLVGYLALPAAALAEMGCYYRHGWEAGQAVIMTRTGTLHRAQPSPAGERIRHTLRQFVR